MDQSAYFEQMRNKRKTEILCAARKLMLAFGPDAFNMQQLARTLDISTVTLYKYYKNSDDIVLALQQDILQDLELKFMKKLFCYFLYGLGTYFLFNTIGKLIDKSGITLEDFVSCLLKIRDSMSPIFFILPLIFFSYLAFKCVNNIFKE